MIHRSEHDCGAIHSSQLHQSGSLMSGQDQVAELSATVRELRHKLAAAEERCTTQEGRGEERMGGRRSPGKDGNREGWLHEVWRCVQDT